MGCNSTKATQTPVAEKDATSPGGVALSTPHAIVSIPAARVVLPEGLGYTLGTPGSGEVSCDEAYTGTLAGHTRSKVVIDPASRLFLYDGAKKHDVTFLMSHTEEQLKNVGELRFAGLAAYGRVTEVVAGDKFNAVFSFPSSVLYNDSPAGLTGNIILSLNVCISDVDIDRDEKKSCIAVGLLRETLIKNNNIVFCRFDKVQSDHRRRLMASVFVGKDNALNVGRTLLFHHHPLHGRIGSPCSGKKE